MTKSTGLLLGGLGLLAASLVVQWSDAHAIDAVNAAIAELDQRSAAAERRALEAARHIATATNEAQRLDTSLTELARAPSAFVAPTAPAHPSPSAFAVEWAKRWEKQLQDPKAQLENLAVARARLRGKFAPLYRTLHLSAQQISAFEENEATYLAKESDLNAALLEQRIGVQDPVAGELFSQLAAEKNAAQKSVLGESGFAALHEFERTVEVRDLVSRFAGAATVTGEPLNSTQIEELVGAISAADPKYAKGDFAGRDIDWERALAAAQPTLSPRQLNILRDLDVPGGGRLWAVFNAAISRAAEADRKTGAGTAPSH